MANMLLEKLKTACVFGDIITVKKLLKDGLDANSQLQDGKTALMISSEKDRVEIVKMLLQHGANVNQVDDGGWSALTWATVFFYSVSADTIEALLQSGADPNLVNSDGETPFSMLFNELELRAPSKQFVELLLRYGAHIDTAQKTALQGEHTPLMEAVFHDNIKVAQLLLELGADVNKMDENGWTPLTHAVCNAYFTQEDDTNDINAMICLLLKYGANTNIGEYKPLGDALKHGNILIAKLLLENGANVNITFSDGSTPLISTVQIGNEKMIELLLQYNANVNAKNIDGKTAFDYAIESKHDDIIALLRNAGAKN